MKNDTLGRKLQFMIVSKFEESAEASNLLYKLLRFNTEKHFCHTSQDS